MAYITDEKYYTNGNVAPKNLNWGSYQYVSLKDVVNNFQLMYAGDDKLVSNATRYNMLFHAKRGIQEINYDALKNIKILELAVTDDLKFVLPHDYVNYVRISLYKDGVLFPLIENFQTNFSSAYLQDQNAEILFDLSGNALSPENSTLDLQRIKGTKPSLYLNNGHPYHNKQGYCCDGEWYFGFSVGGQYGLNTSLANQNPNFRIDKVGGVINFSSEMGGQLVVLEYVSDGMENGDDDQIVINKLAEDYLYAYIRWAILENKFGVQEYIINRARKEKTAKLRNAKIRLSNLHPGRLLMPLRARAKWIK
ncbi:MAG: hypothetical protein CMJ25_02190 [Phycisphaerae bacterium]|jgi:hypothetical protein|nr:hypothetical protein [Phycisphaerae bacterium]|tara:strand:- start:482 stop:1405 length:924 start_codon:yes stop_codon:yes gene_type:complete